MCSVWPAGPDDKVNDDVLLEGVDGRWRRFDCYGKRKLKIKIGRKQYKIEIEQYAPILGWDFFRRYRLDLIWGDYGDLFLRDKKAKIAKRIENVAYPQNAIPRFNYIAMRTSAATKFKIYGAKIFHTIADEASAPKEHKKEYVELLKKPLWYFES